MLVESAIARQQEKMAWLPLFLSRSGSRPVAAVAGAAKRSVAITRQRTPSRWISTSASPRRRRQTGWFSHYYTRHSQPSPVSNGSIMGSYCHGETLCTFLEKLYKKQPSLYDCFNSPSPPPPPPPPPPSSSKFGPCSSRRRTHQTPTASSSCLE